MDRYWELFRITGDPVFYLLYRQEETVLRAGPARSGDGAAEV